jgi:chemotaxis protein methyltransferase CheR
LNQLDSNRSAVLEYTFSNEVFSEIRDLIYERAGIQLSDSKRSMVYNRLARRIRELQLDGFDAYLRLLRHGGAAEEQAFVNALTTNMTSFFREDYHFPILAQALKERAGQSGPVSIWCSAASTGEEPYSIAITALDALGERHPVSVLSTDIDTNVIETAKRGVYSVDAVRRLDARMLQKHFLRGVGRNEGMVQVQASTRRLVQFAPFNLIQPQWGWREKFDIVFCRNVMIYFDRPTQLKLIERFHQFMKPDGLLFVGHSESFNDCRDKFLLQGRTVYRRVGP